VPLRRSYLGLRVPVLPGSCSGVSLDFGKHSAHMDMVAGFIWIWGVVVLAVELVGARRYAVP
jgi:hypothetical protein